MLRPRVPMKPPSNPLKPEEKMRGVCQTCSHEVKILRQDARTSPKERWLDRVPCCECPGCGATTYLLPWVDTAILFYDI